MIAAETHVAEPGTVYLVGAGPGAPDLLTLRAAALLRAADVILHDDLVTDAILGLAREHALLLNVGKRCGSKRITQDEIHALLIGFARRNLSVVRLKSGDPLVFGRAAEEMDALRAARIPFVVVPGITAAFAAAAVLQCSLTDRRASPGVSFSSAHHAAEADSSCAAPPTRVVYMPGRSLVGIAAQWLREGLPPELPCAVISRAAQPDEQVVCTTLAELGGLQPGPSPTILLAGEVLRRSAPQAARQNAGLAGAVVAETANSQPLPLSL